MLWLYIIISILGWGVWGFSQKMVMRHLDPISAETLYLGLTGAFGMVMYVVALITDTFTWSVSSPGTFWICVSTVASLAATLAFFFALKSAGAGLVTSITSMYPIVTLLLSFLFLHENITMTKGFGILFVILGVILVGI